MLSDFREKYDNYWIKINNVALAKVDMVSARKVSSTKRASVLLLGIIAVLGLVMAGFFYYAEPSVSSSSGQSLLNSPISQNVSNLTNTLHQIQPDNASI